MLVIVLLCIPQRRRVQSFRSDARRPLWLLRSGRVGASKKRGNNDVDYLGMKVRVGH